MLQREESLKLQDFIKKKFPELVDSEIEEIADQFIELGFFLVHLKIKEINSFNQFKNNSP